MKTPASIRHLKIAGILVSSVIVLGTIGYVLIEHLSIIDALYTTIDMMTTVGNLVHPLSTAGRLLTLCVISFGVGALLYTLSAGMEFVVEGHFSQAVRRHFMENRIARLRSHSIICGFGRVGRQIAEDCSTARRTFVVIDDKEQNIQRCIQHGYLAIQGDATNDDILREAGIERAHCVLVATDSDAYNISITLSARHLNPNLFIIARANHPETEAKLKRAGADRGLSPYTIAGHRMASLAFQAGIIEFFDLVTNVGNMELAVEELAIERAPFLDGKSIAHAQETLENGIVIVALKKRCGAMVVPRREARIEEGDTLILIGLPAQLASLKERPG